jgi:hypothetical protein
MWLIVVVAVAAGALVMMPTKIAEHFNDYMVAPKVRTCPDGTRSQSGKCLLEF